MVKYHITSHVLSLSKPETADDVGGRVGKVKDDSFSLARASDYVTTAD
jgi:hypothetical protein